jgi:hypothetical protein
MTEKLIPLNEKASLGNGAGPPLSTLSQEDREALDEAERLLAVTVLTDDDGDEPGERDEVKTPIITKKLPQFAIFQARRVFDLWAASSRDGMDDTIVVTTKTFAPNFENDLELRRCRIYETVTANDNVVRLTWAFIPEARDKTGNTWTISRFNAFEHAIGVWTTMRSRKKLSQYTFRPAAKDHGPPRFSDLTPAQHLQNLKEMGLLVDSRDHPFFKKATDTE